MKAQISWTDFKSRFTLEFNEDYFTGVAHYGCTEYRFAQWLEEDSFLKNRFSSPIILSQLAFSEKRWRRLEQLFVQFCRNMVLIKKYPQGYFEAINDNGYVACLLPDTYGTAAYRISLYTENGPISHHEFNTRDDALDYLVRQNYSPKEGALDSMVGTDKWNCGLWICKWIFDQLAPWEGLERDGHLPEVKRLFNIGEQQAA